MITSELPKKSSKKTKIITLSLAIVLIVSGIMAGAYYLSGGSIFNPLTPEPWTITNISNTKTASSLQNALFEISWSTSGNNIWLVVDFGLRANSDASTLNVKDILVEVDGNQTYGPIGFNYYLENCYIGNLTGTITSKNASLSVAYEASSFDSWGATHHVSGDFPCVFSLSSIKLIYALPWAYLDGNHKLQLKIAGSITGQEFIVERPGMFQGNVAISATGGYVAVTCGKSLYFFEGSSSTPSWIYTSEQTIASPKISSDGSKILATSDYHTLMFSRSSNQLLWNYSGVLAMSADWSRVAVGVYNKTTLGYYINIIDGSSGQILGCLNDTTNIFHYGISSIEDSALSADGRYLAVVAASGSLKQTLYFFDCSTFQEVWRNEISKSGCIEFRSVEISANGNYISALYDTWDGNNSYTIQMYQKNSNITLWQYTFNEMLSSNFASLVLSADGSTLVVRSGSNMTLFNAQSGTIMWTKNQNDFPNLLNSVALSSDGNSIVIGCDNETVFLLNKAGSIVNSRSGLGCQVVMSQDGRFIVAASKTAVHLLDGASLTTVWTYSFP